MKIYKPNKKQKYRLQNDYRTLEWNTMTNLKKKPAKTNLFYIFKLISWKSQHLINSTTIIIKTKNILKINLKNLKF